MKNERKNTYSWSNQPDPTLAKKQLNRLKENAEHIKKIIEMTKDSNLLPKPIEVYQPLPKKTKNNIFTKIKAYFRGLFYKYIIEPELKKLNIEKELTKAERINLLLKESKKNIYETKIYETEKFYESLKRIRKESSSNVSSRTKSPLFYYPEGINYHNEDPNRELKPSLGEIKKIENIACEKILRNQEFPNILTNKAKLILKTAL